MGCTSVTLLIDLKGHLFSSRLFSCWGWTTKLKLVLRNILTVHIWKSDKCSWYKFFPLRRIDNVNNITHNIRIFSCRPCPLFIFMMQSNIDFDFSFFHVSQFPWETFVITLIKNPETSLSKDFCGSWFNLKLVELVEDGWLIFTLFKD